MDGLYVLTIVTSLVLVVSSSGESGRILLIPIPLGSHSMNMERVTTDIFLYQPPKVKKHEILPFRSIQEEYL